MNNIRLFCLLFVVFIALLGFTQRDISPADTLTNRLRLKEMNQQIALGKADHETWYNCGLLKAALKDTAGAIEAYDTSISMKNTHAPSFINRGVIRQKQGDSELAESDYTTAINLDPTSAIAINNRGYLYYELKRYDEAMRDFDASIKRDKEHTEAYMNKVTIYTDQGNKEAAIATCDKMLFVFPDDPKMYSTRAGVFKNFGDFTNALKDWNRAVEVSENDPHYLVERSNFKDDLNDDLGALADCDLAISISPNVAYFHYMRSRPLYDLQDFTGVIEACDKSLELDPKEHRAMVMKANVLDAYGMAKEAMELYELAIATSPQDENAYNQLAISLYGRGDPESARSVLLRFKSTSATKLMSLGQLSADLGEFQTALENFTQLIELDPTSAKAYYMCGLMKDTLQDGAGACRMMLIADSIGSNEAHYFLRKNCRASMDVKQMLSEDIEEKAYYLEMKGDFEGAILLYTEAISIIPEESRLYYNRGKAKRKLENHRGAISDYQKAIDLEPHVDYWVSMGVSYNILEMLNEAKKAYENAIKLDPSYAKSYYNLGILQAQKKNFEKAIELLIESLKHNPGYTMAMISLGDCYMTVGDLAKACDIFKRAEALGDNSVFGKRVRACAEN
ncbi:MAG: tetratricopeptide (TPR) repeat protein [Crocinitomicaceae bacterium]|jgi:tetratricopeptide (TPR) repeat protein